MPRVTGRRVAAILGALGAIALVAAAFVVWPVVVESWHIERLESPDADVRADAARRLGEMRSVRAVPVLVDTLASHVIGPPDDNGFSIHYVASDEWLHRPEARALVAIGTPGARALAAKLEELPEPLREWCAAVLGEMDPPPLAVFADLLEHDDLNLRFVVLEGLGWQGENATGIVPCLVRALERTEDPRGLRVAKSEAEGDIRYALAEFRRAIFTALVDVRADENLVRPALEMLLDDSDLEVRVRAARWLGSIGDDASVPRLAAALRKAAERAIQAERRGDERRVLQLGEFLVTAVESLTRLSGDFANPFSVLVSVLRSPDVSGPDLIDSRDAAVAAVLYEISDLATDDDVVRALASNDADVRRCASWLAEFRSPSRPVFAALIARLDDADDEVRSAAASALVSEMGVWPSDTEPGLVAAATRALVSSGRSTSHWCVQLLAELAEHYPAAREALEAARSHEDKRVRRAVAEALAALSG